MTLPQAATPPIPSCPSPPPLEASSPPIAATGMTLYGVIVQHRALTLARVREITGLARPDWILARLVKEGHVGLERRGAVRVYFIPAPDAAEQVERALAHVAPVEFGRMRDWSGPQARSFIQGRKQAYEDRLREMARRLDRPCFACELGDRFKISRTLAHKHTAEMVKRGLVEAVPNVPLIGPRRIGATTLYYQAQNPAARALALAWAKEAEVKADHLRRQPRPRRSAQEVQEIQEAAP